MASAPARDDPADVIRDISAARAGSANRPSTTSTATGRDRAVAGTADARTLDHRLAARRLPRASSIWCADSPMTHDRFGRVRPHCGAGRSSHRGRARMTTGDAAGRAFHHQCCGPLALRRSSSIWRGGRSRQLIQSLPLEQRAIVSSRRGGASSVRCQLRLRSHGCASWRHSPALHPLRSKMAALMGVPPSHPSCIDRERYQPGSPLGWHRDVPEFDVVGGLSLHGRARMRLRTAIRIARVTERAQDRSHAIPRTFCAVRRAGTGGTRSRQQPNCASILADLARRPVFARGSGAVVARG